MKLHTSLLSRDRSDVDPPRAPAPPAAVPRGSPDVNSPYALHDMRLHAAAAVLALNLAPAAAIFRDDAFHIDFHYALIGIPKHASTFFQKPYAASKASLLYTLSHDHTVGAVNPRDGALVWRQPAPAGEHAKSSLVAGEDQDVVVSAVDDRITALSASDGRIAWDSTVSGAPVEDLEILEQKDGMTDGEVKDVIVLRGGSHPTVQRLDGKTGRVKWTHEDTRQVALAFAPHSSLR